jgi:hypothetical protein
MKIIEMIGIFLGVLLVLVLMVVGFNFLHCNPIGNVLKAILPKVAIAPVVETIQPGSTVEYGRNEIKITPPKASPGKPQLPAKKIWHPIELKPWTDKNNVLHVPQSGFCFVPLAGGKATSNLKDDPKLDWEVGIRIFVAGQLGLEPAGNDKGWSPKIDWRLFDSNLLLSAGPDFSGLSFTLAGGSISLKFDPGFWEPF